MLIAKFWQKSAPVKVFRDQEEVETFCWGWSDIGNNEAKSMAEQRAHSLKGKQVHHAKMYDYGEAPLREFVVKQENFNNELGDYLITVNSYGSVVLNASNIMFVDVDLAEENSGGFFKNLFGKSKPNPRAEAEKQQIDWLNGFLVVNPSLGFRIYRTHSGLRYLETSQAHDPTSDQTKQILTKLNSDPKYRILTNKQKCFRARLTPKPWRIDLSKPPVQFPFDTKEAQDKYTKWQQKYETTIVNYGTCLLLGQIGAKTVPNEIAKIIEIHDTATKVTSGLPLA